MEGNLSHARQTASWGCMWHALYAVTADPRFLDDVREGSSLRRPLHAVRYGWIIHTLFVDLSRGAAPATDSAFWAKWALQAQAEGLDYTFVVSFVHPGGLPHSVGVDLRADGQVAVSDSLLEGIISAPFEVFLSSPYSRAFLVEQLLSMADEFVSEDVEVALARARAQLAEQKGGR